MRKSRPSSCQGVATSGHGRSSRSWIGGLYAERRQGNRHPAARGRLHEDQASRHQALSSEPGASAREDRKSYSEGLFSSRRRRSPFFDAPRGTFRAPRPWSATVRPAARHPSASSDQDKCGAGGLALAPSVETAYRLDEKQVRFAPCVQSRMTEVGSYISASGLRCHKCGNPMPYSDVRDDPMRCLVSASAHGSTRQFRPRPSDVIGATILSVPRCRRSAELIAGLGPGGKEPTTGRRSVRHCDHHADRKPKTKRPSLYRVLLLNDDYTPMEFVVRRASRSLLQ